LVPPRRQCAGRESVRLAGDRVVCAGGADRLGLRAGPGLRAHDGHALRIPEPRDRRRLWPGRSSRADRSMSAFVRHARYVIGENPVTALAAGLFAVLVILAVFGPFLAPHDPLQSDTTRKLEPPSARHWFGTDQVGRDVLSRVIIATRLDLAISLSA